MWGTFSTPRPISPHHSPSTTNTHTKRHSPSPPSFLSLSTVYGAYLGEALVGDAWGWCLGEALIGVYFGGLDKKLCV